MKNKEINGVLISRINEDEIIAEKITYIDTLENLYNILECDLIDIQERKINGQYYDFIFDDEGKMKEGWQDNITAVERKSHEIIQGNILIVGLPNNEGQETSLTDSQIEDIIKAVNPNAYLNISKYGMKAKTTLKGLLIYDI